MITATKDIPIPLDVQAAGPLVIGFYEYLIEEKGNSPRMAEMLALRSPPRVMTDDVMFGGIGTLDSQIKDPRSLAIVVRNAMRHGYRPKPTDFYMPGMADFPGDPKAFFNHGAGRGELKRRLEAKGVASDGLVTTQGRQPDSDPFEPVHALSPKIVERIRKRKLKENPDLARKDQKELRHEIVREHGHNKDR